MESDIRFYRRRANEELAAAERAVTRAARERRLALASQFEVRLKALQGRNPQAVSGIANPAREMADSLI